MAVKAVYKEIIAESLSTDSTILAIRRFIGQWNKFEAKISIGFRKGKMNQN